MVGTRGGIVVGMRGGTTIAYQNHHYQLVQRMPKSSNQLIPPGLGLQEMHVGPGAEPLHGKLRALTLNQDKENKDFVYNRTYTHMHTPPPPPPPTLLGLHQLNGSLWLDRENQYIDQVWTGWMLASITRPPAGSVNAVVTCAT